MSAERLREAARVLRERAEAATPGPWIDAYQTVCVDTGKCGGGACGLGYGHEPGCGLDPLAQTSATDATYIATMHPGVGLALADWLDGVAGAAERKGVRKFARGYKSALIVADAILGGAS